RAEYSLPACAVQRVQVVPMGKDGVVERSSGQTEVIECCVVARELDVAVGANVGTCERLPGQAVQVEGEGQGDASRAIVAVVADVLRARHYCRATRLSDYVIGVSAGGWGHRGCGGRRAGRQCAGHGGRVREG